MGVVLTTMMPIYTLKGRTGDGGRRSPGLLMNIGCVKVGGVPNVHVDRLIPAHRTQLLPTLAFG